MPLKKRDIESQLISKFGFQRVEGSKHQRLTFIYNEKKIATTGFSRGFRGNEDIGDGLLGEMSKQVEVHSLGFFKGMINCPKSRDDYIERLKSLGKIPPEESDL